MQFNQDIVIYLLGLAALGGTILTKISFLEKKVEKHNHLIERMYKVEERTKSNTHRIDELERGSHGKQQGY